MSDERFKAFVGGLPFDAVAGDIEDLLKHCEFDEKDIRELDIHLVHDRDSGSFKGFGYVTFPTEQQLNAVCDKLNGVEYGGRTLKVNRAQARDRNDRGGRGGGRGGFGGDRGGDRGGRGGGRGGFRRGDHGGHHDGHRGGRGGFRQRNQSDAGSHHEDGHRQPRQSEEKDGPSAPPAERPRLNLKPRTTDASQLEARRKQEEEETRKRQEKLFG